MNGQDSNMQGNQNNLNNGINPEVNNGIDSTVLGSVQPAETLGVVQEVQPQPINVGAPVDMAIEQNSNPVDINTGGVNVESNPAPVEPVGVNIQEQNFEPQPIPETMPINDMTSPVGMDPMDNVNSNAFVEPNKVENIGTVPPPEEPKKEKKKMSPILFVILILVLIAGVAFGVYYYLSISKGTASKVNVEPKSDIKISLGETLPTDPSFYANITGTDSSNCTLGLENVDNQNLGEYDFTIKCGDLEQKTGKVIITDTVAPIVALKPVFVKVNSEITVDDFIDSCTDESSCTSSFADEAAVNNYLTTVGGPYNVEIIVSDSLENSKTVTTALYVLSTDAPVTLACESTAQEMTDYKANKTIVDKMPVGSDGTQVGYLNASRREYKYVFTNKEDYNTITEAKETTITFDGNTGLATYDDDNLILTVSVDLDINTLNTEAGGTFPTAFQDLSSYYTGKGYTCEPIPIAK